MAVEIGENFLSYKIYENKFCTYVYLFSETPDTDEIPKPVPLPVPAPLASLGQPQIVFDLETTGLGKYSIPCLHTYLYIILYLAVLYYMV